VTGAISALKTPEVTRFLCPRHRFDGEGVHLFARKAVLVHTQLGKSAHQLALLIGILEAIEEHVVVQNPVAQPITGAGCGQHVRRIGHRLHATGDGDIDRTGQQFVMGNHDRLLGRTAHLGQGDARHRLRQAGAEHRLACRRLTQTCHQAATHQRFIDIFALDARLFDRGLDRNAGQLRRGHPRKLPLEGAHWRALGADDNN
jgi:hypothetical protein